jgi:hypothetical protein
MANDNAQQDAMQARTPRPIDESQDNNRRIIIRLCYGSARSHGANV